MAVNVLRMILLVHANGNEVRKVVLLLCVRKMANLKVDPSRVTKFLSHLFIPLATTKIIALK